MTTIAIDARAASEEPAGRGRVVRELLRALNRRRDEGRFLLYGRSRWEEPLDERFEWRLHGFPDPLWNVWAALDGNVRADGFLSTNSYLTAWFTTIPTAVVVYDTVAWEARDSAQRRAQLIERATIRLALRRAASAICISESTRNDLVLRFPAAAGKARVVPLAADDRFAEEIPDAELAEVRARHGIADEFVLCTGTLEPRKNLHRVLEAHAGLSHRPQLVLVGPRGWESDALLADATARADVRILGHVPDRDLVALYRACSVFCYPSLYEGFGLPLLEAMAAGAACITSNVSSLPEVGGDAVRYVEPTSVEEIRGALDELLGSPELRARLGAKARARAAEFSWDRTAEEIVQLLRSIARR